MTKAHKLIAGIGTTAALVALVSSSSSSAQSSACTERRAQAIGLARQINTLQLHESRAKKTFLPLNELSGVVVPDGLAVQLIHSASEFLFSIKDIQQPDCHVAVFSDQKYVLYTAQPLQ
jgi:hypothetical protein